MIDPERQGGIVLCQRIVRKLREMNDGVEPFQVFPCDVPDVFPDERIEARKAVIEASIRVETSVEADYFVPSFDYRGSEHDANITFYTSYEHSHNVFSLSGFILQFVGFFALKAQGCPERRRRGRQEKK